jgi:hypothetical protein
VATSYGGGVFSYGDAATSYDGVIFSYENAATSYDGGVFPYEDATTSYDGVIFSYEDATTSYDGGVLPHEDATTSYDGGVFPYEEMAYPTGNVLKLEKLGRDRAGLGHEDLPQIHADETRIRRGEFHESLKQPPRHPGSEVGHGLRGLAKMGRR